MLKFPRLKLNLTLSNFWVLLTPVDQFEILYSSCPVHNSLIWVGIVLLCYVISLNVFFSYKKPFAKKIFDKLCNEAMVVYATNASFFRSEHKNFLILLFSLIFSFNLYGLFFSNYTITSAFCITLFVAGTFFLYINLLICLKKKWKALSLLLPAENIYWIAPFLILIEFISYISRVVSLSLRLFANMVAGHALLKILIGFSWSLLTSLYISTISTAILIWIAVTCIFVLELLIAFLQAYVFTLLIVLYLNDVDNFAKIQKITNGGV